MYPVSTHSISEAFCDEHDGKSINVAMLNTCTLEWYAWGYSWNKADSTTVLPKG